jgi:DNA-directed RNA polymerase specialized sigma24 family protein
VTSTAWIPSVVVSSAQDRVTASLLTAGDPEGLRRLLFCHGGRVREALRFEFPSLDEALVDDVMSLASLRVWRSRHRYESERGSLRAWLLVIARHCAIRHLAERNREGLTFTANLDGVPAPAHAVNTALAQMINDVRQCISQLPKQQRAVLFADLAAGGLADCKDLAQELGTTKRSVWVSRANGLRQLRTTLQKLNYPFRLVRRRLDADEDLSEAPA